MTVSLILSALLGCSTHRPDYVEIPTPPAGDDGSCWSALSGLSTSMILPRPLMQTDGPPPPEQRDAWRVHEADLETFAAIRCTGVTLPFPPETVIGDEVTYNVGPLLELSKARLLRAWSLTDEPARAADEMLAVAHLGATLATGNGGLVGAGLGMTVLVMAERELAKLVAHVADPALTTHVQAGLPALPADLAVGAIASEAIMMEPAGQSDPDYTIHHLNQVSRPHAEREEYRGEGVSLLGFIARWDAGIAQHNVLQTWLAAERYRHAVGTPAPDVAALVPAYLDAPLPDPFTKQPLRIVQGTVRVDPPDDLSCVCSLTLSP